MELKQQILNIESLKSGEKTGVFLNFAQTGSEPSHQAVIFTEQGQTSVKCNLMTSPAHWVLSDPAHDAILVVQLVLRNEVSPYSIILSMNLVSLFF